MVKNLSAFIPYHLLLTVLFLCHHTIQLQMRCYTGREHCWCKMKPNKALVSENKEVSSHAKAEWMWIYTKLQVAHPLL